MNPLIGGDDNLDVEECLLREIPAICADWLGKIPVDIPEHIGVERYAEAEQAFANAIAPLSPQVQLFRYGVWHTPGISDIDLLCVVDDDIGSDAIKHIETAPRGLLMVHPPLVLPRSLASSFRWFLPATEIFPIDASRAELTIQTPAPDEFADLCLISSFNAALMVWRALRLERAKPEIRVRGAMLRLWAIRHTVEFAARAGMAIAPAWQSFADDCLAMRTAFSQGNAVDLVELSLTLARGEIIARDVADKAAWARIARSTAPDFTARRIEGGRVRVQIGTPGWNIRACYFGRKQREPYVFATLPRHVAAFIDQSGGQSPFDMTLHKVRNLSAIRARFIDRHRAYGLWSGKQFLGATARRRFARARDRLALDIISALR